MKKITENMDSTLNLDDYLSAEGISYLDVLADAETGLSLTVAKWMIEMTHRCGIPTRAAELEICHGLKTGRLILDKKQ